MMIRNVAIYTFSNVLSRAVPFLLLPVMTTYLTPADYGIVATFQVVAGLLTTFIGLNSNGAVLVNYFRGSTDERRVYIGNVLFVIIANFVVTAVVVYLTHRLIGTATQLSSAWLAAALVIALSQALVAIMLVIWQAKQQAVPYALLQFTGVLLNLLLSLFFIVVLGFYWEGRLYGALLADITLLVGSLLLLLLRKERYLTLKLRREYLRDIYAFGLPLIPHALSGWIMTGVNRLFLNVMVGITSTGIFSVAFQIGMIISVLGSSFNTAWAPYLFDKLAHADDVGKIRVVRGIYLFSGGILFTALLLGVASPLILTIFVGERFYAASTYIIWVAVGYAFESIYMIVGNLIYYAKKTYLLSAITLTCAVLNLALNYLLIRQHGALGAAQATFITYLLYALLTCTLSIRCVKLPWLAGIRSVLQRSQG